MAAFVLAFDSDYLPITGQQLTWRPGTSSAISNRLALLKQQAKVTSPRPACDLQVSGNINGESLSGLYQTDGSWKLKDGKSSSDTALMALATANQPLTFTCLPPGTGARTALALPVNRSPRDTARRRSSDCAVPGSRFAGAAMT